MELYIVLLVHIVGICTGLKDVKIQVPTAVRNGDSAILNCWYDTEGDTLYAVKWYKGRREFYRYAPKDNPAVKNFPIGSLRVNISESNATQIVLNDLELDSAGTYSCEVSADAPSFHTAIASAVMNVVELPNQRPSIHGLKNKYRVGDMLRGNCTSGRSKPAANLTWYINDRQLTCAAVQLERLILFTERNPLSLTCCDLPVQPLQAYVRSHNPVATNDSVWQASQISLQFLLTPQHFSNGKLKVRCSASIYDVYWKSTEVSAEEDRPRTIHFEPAATIVGINYLQPPPNFQTGQRKPDGQVDVKVIGSSMNLQPSLRFVLELFVFVRLVVY